MDHLIKTCRTAKEFPRNLCQSHHVPHSDVLDSYLKRLNNEQTRLFQTEDETAALDFLDLNDNGAGK